MTMMTVRVCSSWASEYMISSESSDQIYFVKFFAREKAVCSCPAYRFSGTYDKQTCKHIRKITQNGCFMWNPEEAGSKFTSPGPPKGSVERLVNNGILVHSTTELNLVDEDCPICGMKLMEVTI